LIGLYATSFVVSSVLRSRVRMRAARSRCPRKRGLDLDRPMLYVNRRRTAAEQLRRRVSLPRARGLLRPSWRQSSSPAAGVPSRRLAGRPGAGHSAH